MEKKRYQKPQIKSSRVRKIALYGRYSARRAAESELLIAALTQ